MEHCFALGYVVLCFVGDVMTEVVLSKKRELSMWAKLTPQLRRYVENRLSGKTPGEAFCLAKGRKHDPEKKLFFHLEGLKLERHKLVRPVLEMCSKAEEERLIEMYRCSSGTHLRDLAKIRDAAIDDGKYTAAVKAEELRGRSSGLYVEQIEGNLSISFADAVRQIEGEYVEVEE